jgi:hypothetical protein
MTRASVAAIVLAESFHSSVAENILITWGAGHTPLQKDSWGDDRFAEGDVSDTFLRHNLPVIGDGLK